MIVLAEFASSLLVFLKQYMFNTEKTTIYVLVERERERERERATRIHTNRRFFIMCISKKLKNCIVRANIFACQLYLLSFAGLAVILCTSIVSLPFG